MIAVGAWILPVFIAITILAALLQRLNVYDEFVAGASTGVRLGLKLIPFVIGINIAIGLLRDSGVMSWLSRVLYPLLALTGLPADVLPLLIFRPFSNEAAMGIVTELLHTHGPDSFIGLLTSVIQGSSDTTFYVLTLYLGSAGIRKHSYILPLCLFGDLIGYLAALLFTYLFFGP